MSFPQQANRPALEEPGQSNTVAIALTQARRRQPRGQTARTNLRTQAVWGSLALTALLVSGCAGTSSSDAGTMPASTSSGYHGMAADAAPLETASSSDLVPIYWLGRSGDSVYLYREFSAPVGGDDPIVTALRAMMTNKPKDPDYFSMWSSPSRLGASISNRNQITLDVSSDAFKAKVDAGIAERSIAQLVYTATAAAAAAGQLDSSAQVQVTILVDGHSGYKAFKHVVLDRPLSRNQSYVAPVWITNPSFGEDVKGSTLTIQGQATSPSGELSWSIVGGDEAAVGKTAKRGTLTLARGKNERSDYVLSLAVAPGKYVLTIYATDPLDAEEQVGTTIRNFEVLPE